MAQIIQTPFNPKRCNLAAIQSGGSQANTVLENGEIWFVDTTNAEKGTKGYGHYDAYIVGDGETGASALEVNPIDDMSAFATKQELAAKQDVINDLATIRSGAADGAIAYQKPSSGIPASDMASTVQISLDKADAAAPQSTTYTKTEVDAALALKQTSSQLATINGSRIDQGGNVTIIAAEGQTITIDAAPMAGSNNAVSSGGVYDGVSNLDGQINGASEETTTNYSEAGYIKLTDGSIITGNTWIHTPLLPVDAVKEFGIIKGHGSVAAVAFYSTADLSSFISGIRGGSDAGTCPVGRVVLMSEISIPEGTNYVAFSTDGSVHSLTVKIQVSTPGLTERVSNLEGGKSELDARVSALENNVVTSPLTKTLHFSFDDMISAFYDIVHNNRASIFDNAFFGALKNLHETYGAVFSCYCFLDYIITKYVSNITTITTPNTSAVYYLSAQDGEYAPDWYVYKNGSWTAFENVVRADYVLFSLSSFPSTFASEFSENAKWLKFGFHCKDGMSNYGSATAEEAATDYNSFITSILAITGTPECVDTVVRLQNFSGTLNACRGLRDADLGVQGFLCADYSEANGGSGGMNQGYYLTNYDASAVWKKGQIYDYSERLHFYMSALRIDATTGANMPAYMATFLTPAKWEQTAMIEMYAHENQMFNATSGAIAADYIVRFTTICTWAKNNGFIFGYQMDKIRMAF